MRKYRFKKWYWKVFVGLVDWIGDRLFMSKIRQNSRPQEIRKILLMRLDHLGDGILLVPMIKALRQTYPQAKIAAIFSREVAQVFEGSPFLDRIWIWEKHWLSRDRRRLWSGSVQRTLREIKEECFELGIDSRGDLRNIAFLALGRVRYRVGYSSAGGGFLLHEEFEERLGEHEINRNLRVLENFHLKAVNCETEVSVSSLPKKTPKGAYVVVHGGAGTQAKQWPSERWQILIQDFIRKNWSIVLVGKGDQEDLLAQQFENEVQVTNFVNQLSLRETWAVIQQAKLFIGADSGLAHGAGALGCRTIVLESGTTEPAKWAVQGPHVERIHHPVFCAPCHLETCRFLTHDCMQEISVERVKREAEKIFQSSS